MADLTFNTTPGQTIGREMLIAYLNTGESGSPKWAAIGKRVEDSSAEYDWQTETKVDIFGNTYTTGKKPTITQTFEPCELDADDKAQEKIWNLSIKDQNVNALMNMDMLIVRRAVFFLFCSSVRSWRPGRRHSRHAAGHHLWRHSHYWHSIH